jgi:hypothetical protein
MPSPVRSFSFDLARERCLTRVAGIEGLVHHSVGQAVAVLVVVGVVVRPRHSEVVLHRIEVELVGRIQSVVHIAIEQAQLVAHLEHIVGSVRRLPATTGIIEHAIGAVELLDGHLVHTKGGIGREHIVLAAEEVAVDGQLKSVVGHPADVLHLHRIARHRGMVDL